MNWLKNLLNGALNNVKADALREIDRAISKLDSGQSASEVVNQLRQVLSGLIAMSKLGAAGGFLADMLLAQFDWSGLASRPVDVIRAELVRLRKQVIGARF